MGMYVGKYKEADMKDSIWKRAGEKTMAVAAWVVVAPAACFTTALFFALRGLEWCRLGKNGRNFKKRQTRPRS
jgi:hypothetical protein